MPDSSISGLPDLGIPKGDEKIEVVADPSGIPTSRRSRFYLAGGFVNRSRFIFYAFHDFLTGSGSDLNFASSVSGAGAALTNVVAPNNEAGIGFCRFDLGTTATGRTASIARVVNITLEMGAIRFYHGAARWAAKISITQLGNVTDNYTARMGFIDDETAEPNDGCYFRYNHNVNAGKWQAVCRKNAVETTVDTGIAPAAGEVLKRFEIRTNSAASSVEFYIGDVLKATITTNIPNANVETEETGFGIAVIRSAGTAVLPAMTADYQEVEQIFNTAR